MTVVSSQASSVVSGTSDWTKSVGLLGVEAQREHRDDHVEGVGAELLGVADAGQRVVVGDEVVGVVLALEVDELPQCAEVVADVQGTRRLDSRQDAHGSRDSLDRGGRISPDVEPAGAGIGGPHRDPEIDATLPGRPGDGQVEPPGLRRARRRPIRLPAVVRWPTGPGLACSPADATIDLDPAMNPRGRSAAKEDPVIARSLRGPRRPLRIPVRLADRGDRRGSS